MRVGFDSSSERELFILELSDGAMLPMIHLSSPRFVCLAWDAEKTSDKTLALVANWLLDAGAVYLCCWGRDCERVHDAIDDADINKNPSCEPVVMTTWHSKEPLDEAIYFALNIAWPDGEYAEGCGCVLAVCVANHEMAETVRAAFADPRRFSNRLCPESEA
jgi:hypothetical protein